MGNTYKVESWYVQGGDSISLANGHRLRLGQINTTEMAHKARPAQAYAQQAKDQLDHRLGQQNSLYLQLQPSVKDRYSRWLVKVYDGAGVSVEEFLVARGLAYVVSMDTQGAEDCLWQQEAVASTYGLGIWHGSLPHIHAAAVLTPKVGGVIRMGGRGDED